jgi:hypothetical protein
MSEKDFFRALRAKLERRPSASFDSDFWRKFDREFGEKSSYVSRWFTLPRAMIASAAGLGMIAGGAALWINYSREVRRQEEEQVAIVNQSEMLLAIPEQVELVENLSLLENFREFSKFTEKDWKVLLGKS